MTSLDSETFTAQEELDLRAKREALLRPPKDPPPPPTQRPSVIEAGEIKGLSELARSACHWVEKYCHVDDEGSRLRLYPAQVRFMRDIFRTDSKGNRLTRVGVFSVGRGGGKSTLSAAITLYTMTASGCARGGWWFLTSNSLAQSGLIYDYILRMIARSPQIRKRYEVSPSAKRLLNTQNLNALEALGWNPAAAQGRRPIGWVNDELSEARDSRMLTAMTMAATKVTKGVGLVVSTWSTAPGNPLEEFVSMTRSAQSRGQLKDHVIHVHAPDLTKKGQTIWTKKALRIANPALEADPPMLDWAILEADREKAKHSSIERAEYIARRLNASSGMAAALVDSSRWREFGVHPNAVESTRRDHAGARVTVGIDLSVGTGGDLSSVVVFCHETGYLEAMSWLPEASILDAETRDKAPYRDWAKAGWLRLSEGRVIDYGDVSQYLADLHDRFSIGRVHFDPYLMPNLKPSLEAVGIEIDSPEAEKVWVPHRQGYKSWTPSIIEVKRRIASGSLLHLGDPVLTMGMTTVLIDSPVGQASDAYRPVKPTANARIDPAVAAIMAMAPFEEEVEIEGAPSHYLDMIGA